MDFGRGLSNLDSVLRRAGLQSDSEQYLDFIGWQRQLRTNIENERRHTVLSPQEQEHRERVLRELDRMSLHYIGKSFLDLCTAKLVPKESPDSSAQTGESMETPPSTLAQLQGIMTYSLTAGELRTLCFDMRIDYDVLSGEGKAEKVLELIRYLNSHQRIPELIRAGRRLRSDISWEKHAGEPTTNNEEPDPIQGLKEELVDELAKLSQAQNPTWRTSLLDGIPGADALSRDWHTARVDLVLIIMQLGERGRMANGELPLVKLIDNALPYVEGFRGEERLRSIQQKLETA